MCIRDRFVVSFSFSSSSSTTMYRFLPFLPSRYLFDAYDLHQFQALILPPCEFVTRPIHHGKEVVLTKKNCILFEEYVVMKIKKRRYLQDHRKPRCCVSIQRTTFNGSNSPLCFYATMQVVCINFLLHLAINYVNSSLEFSSPLTSSEISFL